MVIRTRSRSRHRVDSSDEIDVAPGSPIPPSSSSKSNMKSPINLTTSSSSSSPSSSSSSNQQSNILKIIFVALLIDILSFTIILPLLPRALVYYQEHDGKDPTSLFSRSLRLVHSFRTFIGGNQSNFDIILFGGFLGSLYSFLQFIVSPFIGKLSDKYGRRKVLLVCMIGNMLSTGLWVFAKRFEGLVLSRILAGLSEGNVQMSIAMITDVTTKEKRSKGLALVGIAFAFGFTFGPPLGAFFASIHLLQVLESLALWTMIPTFLQTVLRDYVYEYSSPALLAFSLVAFETIYIYYRLPETQHWVKEPTASAPPSPRKTPTPSSSPTHSPSTSPQTRRQRRIEKLQNQQKPILYFLFAIQFMFLFLFSGIEFTLPFLTYDVYQYTASQKGKLLGIIGIASAFLQAGYVRRVVHKRVDEKSLVLQGIAACCLTSWALSRIPLDTTSTGLLVAAGGGMALTTATVVGCLTSITSLVSTSIITDPSVKLPSSSTTLTNEIGKDLGAFRSIGQLGRAIGPLTGCVGYWWLGASHYYFVAFCCMSVLLVVSWWTLPLAKSIKVQKV